MPPLTVLITCKDERRHIRACLDSVRPLADEILVADSGSTDGTLDIIRDFGGCRIIEREYNYDTDFKNWALPQATHDWVLVVDADERATPAIIGEIRRLLAGEPPCDGYRIAFDTTFLGQPIRYCGWNTATSLRLFRRSVGRYQDRRVHGDVEIDTGRIGRLEAKLLHHTAVDLSEFVRKQVRYSGLAAADGYRDGQRTSSWSLLAKSSLRFWQLYLFRGGFLDGTAGFVVCSIMAFYSFLKEAQLWGLELDGVAEPEAALPQPVDSTASPSRRAA